MFFSCHVALWVLSVAHQIVATPVLGRPERKRIQYRVDQDRANGVKEAFQFAWDGYHKYAFPHDELKPVSRGFGDSRNGWGASAVDALSTAIIMELPDVVNTIIGYIPKIDYSVTNDSVSLFETTIRYLGGMLAGYDLLTGPFERLASNDTQVDALLAQSKRLGDILSFAFNTSSGIPDNNLHFNPYTLDGSETNGIATIGTLVLEWTRLSDLTKDPKYANLTQKAESYLLKPHPALGEPFPGLLGINVNISDGMFKDGTGGWVGGADSFYEYLIKMWVYDNSRFSEYRDRWILAADSSIRYAASHPSSRPDLTFLAEWQGTDLVYESEHLACFDGGNFLLGGLVLGEQKYIDFGLKLTAGCRETYKDTFTRIGPESFGWVPSTCNNTKGTVHRRVVTPIATVDTQLHSNVKRAINSPVPKQPTATRDVNRQQDPAYTSSPCSLPAQYQDQTAFYEKNGFYITQPSYITRPEVIESYYYAYRITGDAKYQDWAWDAFVAINATARQGVGFTEIRNVNAPGGGSTGDNQESFLFAEVMKYSYMIFADDGPWQVNYGGGEGEGEEQFVFNTEAHPFKVVRGGEQYRPKGW